VFEERSVSRILSASPEGAGDDHLSRFCFATGLKRATKLALTPKWVYHACMSPCKEMRSQKASHHFSRFIPPKAELVLSLWHRFFRCRRKRSRLSGTFPELDVRDQRVNCSNSSRSKMYTRLSLATLFVVVSFEITGVRTFLPTKGGVAIRSS